MDASHVQQVLARHCDFDKYLQSDRSDSVIQAICRTCPRAISRKTGKKQSFPPPRFNLHCAGRAGGGYCSLAAAVIGWWRPGGAGEVMGEVNRYMTPRYINYLSTPDAAFLPTLTQITVMPRDYPRVTPVLYLPRSSITARA